MKDTEQRELVGCFAQGWHQKAPDDALELGTARIEVQVSEWNARPTEPLAHVNYPLPMPVAASLNMLLCPLIPITSHCDRLARPVVHGRDRGVQIRNTQRRLNRFAMSMQNRTGTTCRQLCFCCTVGNIEGGMPSSQSPNFGMAA